MEPKQGIEALFSLTVYGPLGVIAILGVIAAVVFYRDWKKAAEVHVKAMKDREDAHAKAMKDCEDAHDAQLIRERAACELERKSATEELRKLEERYIAKTETQLEKYNTLASALKDVVGSAMRRYRSARDTETESVVDDGSHPRR